MNESAAHFELTEFIRFNTKVVRVERDDLRHDQWVVESRNSESRFKKTFDAVVVCNDRFTQPRLPRFPGREKWPGKQIHSHNYRVPDIFKDQIVVVIGDGASGRDIALEISAVAKQVHLSSRSPNLEISNLKLPHNMWYHPQMFSILLPFMLICRRPCVFNPPQKLFAMEDIDIGHVDPFPNLPTLLLVMPTIHFQPLLAALTCFSHHPPCFGIPMPMVVSYLLLPFFITIAVLPLNSSLECNHHHPSPTIVTGCPLEVASLFCRRQSFFTDYWAFFAHLWLMMLLIVNWKFIIS